MVGFDDISFETAYSFKGETVRFLGIVRHWLPPMAPMGDEADLSCNRLFSGVRPAVEGSRGWKMF